jgi:outer membrane receptor protein involved in Fe transport
MIGATTIASRLKGFDGDLEARVRFAFRRARTDDTWYTGSADEKFRAALGGVILSLPEDSPERESVERSLAALRSLSASMSGIHVDMSSVFHEDLLPLMGWWREEESDV